jgi:methylenetetrahydrofolate dehydrogenase (NADP+)/methenyltetrahydrofolate cyclohydrolase
MHSRLIRRPLHTTTAELLTLLCELNTDPAVNGILVQLPLPAQIDAQDVLDAVCPLKDVDAFAPENVGLLVQGRPRFLPCTPHGVMQILARYGHSVAGKHVVVIGRSDIVGKPLANMLLQRDIGLGPKFANATVTVCHSQSTNLAAITSSADILVAAVGRPRLITANMVKAGAIVIDVGINREGDKLVGDVDFESVSEVATAITPVPGGIGPLTIAMLLRNTLTAAKLQSLQNHNPRVRC